MTSRLVWNEPGFGSLRKDPGIWQELEVHANRLKAAVQAPSSQIVTVKRGIARSGRTGEPFAQVIMRGPGALAIEFGARGGIPQAPLRKALATTF